MKVCRSKLPLHRVQCGRPCDGEGPRPENINVINDFHIKEKVAEAILNHRVTSTAKRNHTEYLVKWRGCSSEENTWERVTNLKAFLPLIEAYHASQAPRTSSSHWGRMSKAARAIGTLDAHFGHATALHGQPNNLRR
ncbi:UNVERIFIED_CONTAM: hypothetical protein Sindi_0656400 [Sesamum indicum]